MFSRLRRKKIADAEGDHTPHKPAAAKSMMNRNDEAERISQDFMVASLEALKEGTDSVESEAPSEAAEERVEELSKSGEEPGDEAENLAEQIMAAGRIASSAPPIPPPPLQKPPQKKTESENKLYEHMGDDPISADKTSDNNEDLALPRRQLDEILLEIVRRDIDRKRGVLRKKSLD